MHPNEVSLIRQALASLEQVLNRSTALNEVPAVRGPTELATLSDEDRRAAEAAEQAKYRDDPALSAAHLCLTSACALLDVSQILLEPGHQETPEEQAHLWNELMGHTKIAGRAAYRAALILADPNVAVDASLPSVRKSAFGTGEATTVR